MKRTKRISISDNTRELIQKAYPKLRSTVGLELLVQRYFRLQDQVDLYQKTLDDETQRRRKLQAMCDKRDKIIAGIIIAIVATGLMGIFVVVV